MRAEPVQLKLSRLLRVAQESEITFGHPIGVDDTLLAEQELQFDSADALDIVVPRIQPPGDSRTWLVDSVKQRGVLAALPPTAGLSTRAAERIMRLNERTSCGQMHWWLEWLRGTPLSHTDSHTNRTFDRSVLPEALTESNVDLVDIAESSH